MTTPSSTRQEVTQLLGDWSGGDEGALEKLFPLVQPELHRLAHHYMSRERAGQGLALPSAERGRNLMEAERWKQVNDLFQSALERAPAERAAFLDEACHGDESLRRELGSLLTSYERSENFIELPAFQVAPELVTNDRTGALVGKVISHYRIESLIGVGGMGEVYLARDERLGRKAALKLLPDSLTTDETQLSRFKNEARTASSLNHPNILTVYEI